MSLTSRAAVTAGQKRAEEEMIEHARIDRALGVTSDDHGRPVIELADPPIYEGICKIKSFRPYESEREVVGSTSVSQRYDAHIPAPERMAFLIGQDEVQHWNGPVRNGDFITRLTAEGKTIEVYRLATEHETTFQTAQRLVADLQLSGMQADEIEADLEESSSDGSGWESSSSSGGTDG